MLSESLEKDTLKNQIRLQPILELAKKKNSIALEWAYYMVMADSYSIGFDQTNATSDQFYNQAAQLLKQNPTPELEMIGNMRQGYYNYVYREVIRAFPFFLKANDLIPQVDINKTPLLTKHFRFAASFFGHIGDQKKAIFFLREAIPFSKPATRELIDLLNSISYYLAADSINSESLKYLKKALKEAESAKDSVWIGILSGNLANYYWKDGNIKQALVLTQLNIELSLRYNEQHDAMRTMLNLANKYISLHNWDQAKSYVVASKKLMEDKPYFLKYKMEASKALADIAHGTGQHKEELNHLRHYIVLKDSLEKRTNVKELQRIIWESEQEKYSRSLEIESEKRQQTRRRFQLIALTLLLTFSIILLFINRSKARIKLQNASLEKEQLKLLHKNHLVDQELLILKNSLNEFTDTIKQNDILINQLRQELAKEENKDPNYIAEVTANLNALLQTHIMTDERWIKFRHAFDKVNPGYLLQMKEKHPKITENDLRILALQKLDLNNSSMSELLCISVEGIKKAKQRLKKKLDWFKILCETC